MFTCVFTNIAGSPFVFLIQPKDVCCKPGDKAEFTVSTSPSDTRSTYQWYFDNQAISLPDGQNFLSEYKGQQSECLLVLKLLPRHKGVYWCVAEDASGTRITSQYATLTAGTCPLIIVCIFNMLTMIIINPL